MPIGSQLLLDSTLRRPSTRRAPPPLSGVRTYRRTMSWWSRLTLRRCSFPSPILAVEPHAEPVPFVADAVDPPPPEADAEAMLAISFNTFPTPSMNPVRVLTTSSLSLSPSLKSAPTSLHKLATSLPSLDKSPSSSTSIAICLCTA